MTGARLRRLRRLAVLDPAFVAQVTTFLSLLLALGGLAVFVHLFFDEPGAFLHFTFNAHDDLLAGDEATRGATSPFRCARQCEACLRGRFQKDPRHEMAAPPLWEATRPEQ